MKDDRITDSQVHEAMETVGLHETCLELYDTPYKKDLFSKGQEQLLNIARAAVMKPQIFLLDEMSSKLDSKSEERIHNAIDTVGKNKTSVSISHRLSSMLTAQRLIYIKDGEIDRIFDLAGNEEDINLVVKQAAIEGFSKE